MIRMEVVMNDEKILSDDELDLQVVYDLVREICEDCGLIYNNEEECFYGSGDNGDSTRCLRASVELKSRDWFMDNVKSWTSYHWKKDDKSDMESQNWLTVSNMSRRLINFKLSSACVRKNCGGKSMKQAIREIEEILTDYGFVLRNHMGYLVEEEISDEKVFELIDELNAKLTWLKSCAKLFTIERIGEVVDYSDFIKKLGEEQCEK